MDFFNAPHHESMVLGILPLLFYIARATQFQEGICKKTLKLAVTFVDNDMFSAACSKHQYRAR